MKKEKNEKMKDKECSYENFLVLFAYTEKAVQEELLAKLRAQPRPDKLCGKDVPKSLNGISYGVLDDLKTCATGDGFQGTDKEDDILGGCARILLGIEPRELQKENVNDVFGFANFVTDELERINKLFKSIKIRYSKEEIAAGILELDFGSFGILDWYAMRMGMVNQNEVRNVAWVRIFQCMKIDCVKNEYERKLSQQYKKLNKRK